MMVMISLKCICGRRVRELRLGKRTERKYGSKVLQKSSIVQNKELKRSSDILGSYCELKTTKKFFICMIFSPLFSIG